MGNKQESKMSFPYVYLKYISMCVTLSKRCDREQIPP